MLKGAVEGARSILLDRGPWTVDRGPWTLGHGPLDLWALRRDQRKDEDADHQEGEGDLDEHADDHAQPGGDADVAGADEVTVVEVLADGGAQQGHEQQAPEAAEDAGDGADEGADDGFTAGADLLGAQDAGDVVQHPGHDGDGQADADGQAADDGEVVDPGREQDAQEDEEDAGQCRQHGAGDADEDQRDADQPEGDGEGGGGHGVVKTGEGLGIVQGG